MEYVLYNKYFKHIPHNEHNGFRRIYILHIMLQMADKHVKSSRKTSSHCSPLLTKQVHVMTNF